MTHSQTTFTDARAADRVTLHHVLQQAVDHYPHLLAVCFTLRALMAGEPAAAQASMLRFHARVHQRIDAYAQARIGTGKPSPPTLLRWAWERQHSQARIVLLLNQDICYHPRYDASIDERVEDIASLRWHGKTLTRRARWLSLASSAPIEPHRTGSSTSMRGCGKRCYKWPPRWRCCEAVRRGEGKAVSVTFGVLT